MPDMDKVFNDSVHGHIKLPPLCVKIIDTVEFQRLRNIKQLGLVYLVYPGASHNRFEHSLGVCYLAGLFVDHLQVNCPVDITKEEKLCVEIAGLCHDLGHGPFSHVWERIVNPIRVKKNLPEWAHESSSLAVFDLLIQNNNLMEDFNKYNLFEQDIEFIKELILGKTKPDQNIKKEKPYLYQIIANKDNDIDVDKWDYLLRDSFHLNLQGSFDYRRLLESCRVVRVPQDNNSWHICYRDKDALNIYNMFHLRALLHYQSYQHPVVKCLDTMLIDAFTAAAESGYCVPQPDGKMIPLFELQDTASAWCRTSDHLLYDLLYGLEPAHEPAKHIIQRIQRREMYTLVAKCTLDNKSELCEKNKLLLDFCNGKRNFNEFRMTMVKLNFGSANDNPFEKVYFYEKRCQETAASKPIKDILLFPIERSYFKRYELLLFCTRKKSDVTEDDKKDIQNLLSPSPVLLS